MGQSALGKAMDDLQTLLVTAVPEPTDCEKAAALIYALQQWRVTHCPGV